jgi:hypothetical protein
MSNKFQFQTTSIMLRVGRLRRMSVESREKFVISQHVASKQSQAQPQRMTRQSHRRPRHLCPLRCVVARAEPLQQQSQHDSKIRYLPPLLSILVAILPRKAAQPPNIYLVSCRRVASRYLRMVSGEPFMIKDFFMGPE